MVQLDFMKQILACVIIQWIVQTWQLMSGARLSDISPPKDETCILKILFANQSNFQKLIY